MATGQGWYHSNRSTLLAYCGIVAGKSRSRQIMHRGTAEEEVYGSV